MSRMTTKEKIIATAKRALYHIVKTYPDHGSARVAQGTLSEMSKIKARAQKALRDEMADDERRMP